MINGRGSIVNRPSTESVHLYESGSHVIHRVIHSNTHVIHRVGCALIMHYIEDVILDR